MSKINIAILTNCMFAYEGFRKILSKEKKLNILKRITSLDSISRLTIKPDIIFICSYVLMNYVGISEIKKISKENSAVKFIIYNIDSKDEDLMIWLIKFGVRGIFYREDNPSILIKMIGEIYKGELWIRRKSLVKLLKEKKTGDENNEHFKKLNSLLTPRQGQILQLISEGCNNSAIAQKLYISEHTVKFHIQMLFKKLHCRNRVEAAFILSKNLE